MTTPIIALDVASESAARAVVELLGDECRFYKVGSELFTAAGPGVVRMLRDAGCEVFLDLKFHDIPNTVRSAARSAAGLGATLLTVHASGGRAMVEAAVDGAAGSARILAVTVLTSHTAASVGESWGRGDDINVLNEVLRLARLARGGGAAGVVCSGWEAAAVRAQEGEACELLVPGVRLPGGAAHDQTRVVRPGEAAAAGAHFIVVGRAVTAAPDPVAALRQVRQELIGQG